MICPKCGVFISDGRDRCGNCVHIVERYSGDSPSQSTFPKMTERMTVEGRPLGYLFLFGTLAIVCFLGGLVVMGYIAAGLASGVLVIDRGLIYLIFGALVMFPLSIYSLIKMSTKRSIDIGPEGVAIKVKNRIIYSFTWGEIAKITTKPNYGNYPSKLGFLNRDGTEIIISSKNISGAKLKEGFKLLNKYCQFHCINVENEAGW